MELLDTWTAIHNQMPGSPYVLRVTGRVRFESGGWRAELLRSEPQGINPRSLLLELSVVKDGDVQNDVLTTIEVHYTEATEEDYDEVTIHVNGAPKGKPVEDKSIPVQIVR